MANADQIAKLRDLMKDTHSCMLTTMTQAGDHVSRPMGVQQAEFDGDLWFFTFKDSNKVHEIAVNPNVNVSFSSDSKNTWISVTGTAESIDDKQKAEDLWNPLLKAWFPDGLETDGLSLIKVSADSAEYWDSSSSTAVNLFGMVKAAVTGKQAEGGKNETVQL